MRLTSTEFSILEQYYLNEIEENKTRLVRVMCNRDITYDDDLVFEQKNRINKKIALIENRMEELKKLTI